MNNSSSPSRRSGRGACPRSSWEQFNTQIGLGVLIRSANFKCRMDLHAESSIMSRKSSLIRVCAVSIALTLAYNLERFSAQVRQESTKRMADGKQWTGENLSVKSVPSYCYEDAEKNCQL